MTVAEATSPKKVRSSMYVVSVCCMVVSHVVTMVIWGCRGKRHAHVDAHAHQTVTIYIWTVGLRNIFGVVRHELIIWCSHGNNVNMWIHEFHVIRHEYFFLLACFGFHGQTTTHACSSFHNRCPRTFSKQHILTFFFFFDLLVPLLPPLVLCVRKSSWS